MQNRFITVSYHAVIFRTVYNTTVNKSIIEAPETISLGSTINTSVAPASMNSTSATSRSVMQRPVTFAVSKENKLYCLESQKNFIDRIAKSHRHIICCIWSAGTLTSTLHCYRG